MKKLTDILLFGVFSICGGVAATLAVWTWVPSPAAYVSANIDTQSAEVVSDVIRIKRSYCVNQRVPILITRDMVKVDEDNQVEVRFVLPPTNQIYEKGCHNIVRIFPLPAGIQPGTYRIINTASWQANPIRRDSTVLPPLTVIVPASK